MVNNKKKEAIQTAKNAVWYHTECVLLTKDEYEELKKYKAAYKDLQGSLSNLIEQFKRIE